MKTQHFIIVLAAVAILFTACKPDKEDIPATNVTLNYEELTLIPRDTITLIATVQPDNATNKTVTWTSSNPAVAIVNDNGFVEALANGEATITATTQDGNKTATCIVTVDYRSQWRGDWDFCTHYVFWIMDIGIIQDTVYYDLVKISLGNASDELNIKYAGGSSIKLNVDENGKVLNVSFPDLHGYGGDFEKNNKLHLHLETGGNGGGGRYTIDGIKKEGDKK